jgi:hypothetical protein
MIKWNPRQIWIVPLVLALAVLACGPATEPTATPLPRPTQIPFPTATTAAPRPTARPVATKPVAHATATTPPDQPTADNSTGNSTAGAPFELDTTPYVHQTGAFTVTLPAGWTKDEKDHSVYVTSPDKVANIEILFDNVGYAFDATTMNTYITAAEKNFFGTFDSYTPNKFEPQNDGSILVYKTLKLSDGTARTVFSYYWQDGTTVYEQDFWVDTPQYDAYVKPLLAVANSMVTDATAAANATVTNNGTTTPLTPYGLIYQYTDPAKLFQFSVPYAWTVVTSKGNHSSVVTFTSPDSRSYVENITYDDGTTVSKSDAGAFARTLLSQYYKLTDIKITDDKVQPDGSHLLVWNSAASGLDGESFFETRGTTFLLLTWVVNTADYDTFRPMWTTLVKSYTVPK